MRARAEVKIGEKSQGQNTESQYCIVHYSEVSLYTMERAIIELHGLQV